MEFASIDRTKVTAIVETEAVRARDEILATVTHDLGTPLSAHTTAVSLLDVNRRPEPGSRLHPET
jgi:K+-sensing histidine kinase KdpD